MKVIKTAVFFVVLSVSLNAESIDLKTERLEPNYHLWNKVIDGGGEEGFSANYHLKGSIGQSTIGNVTSASYVANIGYWGTIGGQTGTGIEEQNDFQGQEIPGRFYFSQNLPNPFSHRTRIRYTIPRDTKVNIKIYNIAGQVIKTLISEQQKPGFYQVMWDGTDNHGRIVGCGIYFSRMEAADFISIKKMVLLR